MFAAEHDAIDIDGADAMPLVERRVLRIFRHRTENAGIVDEDVEPAMTRKHAVDDALPIVVLAHVVQENAVAGGIDACRALGVGRDDGRAFTGEDPRGRRADHAKAAGDERDLAVEP